MSLSEKKGLFINCMKTVCLVDTKQKETLICNIKKINGGLNQVKGFSYLGSWITLDGRCNRNVVPQTYSMLYIPWTSHTTNESFKQSRQSKGATQEDPETTI